MIYLRVRWLHNFKDEPIEIYSELDQHRWERRKIEMYADGSAHYASKNIQTGNVGLSLEAIPLLDQINVDSQFQGAEIAKEDFEHLWSKVVK